jgi:glycosyltransferase involved in cell wall biosynthesis
MLSPFAQLHFGLDENNTSSFIDSNEFDVVIIIDSEEYIRACRELTTNPEIVIEVHTSIEKNLEYLNRLKEADVNHFITVSEYMIARIEHHRSKSVSQVPITLFENVLDSTLFQPNNDEFKGPPIVLWVGKIDDHKDWRTFMQICQQVSVENPDVEYWIVGGQTCPEELAQQVFENAESLGLIGKFRWFDRIENDMMGKMYSLTSSRGGVNLVTSHGESFGMAVLESLLAECPIVSTDVGALSEITDTSSYFQLYELGDIKSASKLCNNLLGDSSKHASAVLELRNIRDSLIERYCSSARSSDYWQLLRKIGGMKIE